MTNEVKAPIALAILMLVGLGLFAWSRGLPVGGPPAPVAPERIRIANIGIYSNYNLIAAEKGFFRENGLEAEIVEYDSGATSMSALLSGLADVAVAANFVGVRNIFAHDDLRILATVSSHDVWKVMARSDKGVAKPSDLKGKRIGVTLRTAGEFYLGKFLTSNGLRTEDVQVVDLSATEILAQFEDGRIDAALVFDPNAYRLERAMGGGTLTWSAQGSRRELATAYTTRQLVETRPDVLERYLRALVQAEEYQAANEAEAKRLLAGKLGYEDAYMDHLWSEFDFGVRLDQELLVTMEDQARWNIDKGLVEAERAPDYLGYIHFPALEKAKPAGVTIIHRP